MKRIIDWLRVKDNRDAALALATLLGAFGTGIGALATASYYMYERIASENEISETNKQRFIELYFNQDETLTILTSDKEKYTIPIKKLQDIASQPSANVSVFYRSNRVFTRSKDLKND